MALDWLDDSTPAPKRSAAGPVPLVHAKKLFEVLDHDPKSISMSAWTWGQIQRELFAVGGCGWLDAFGKLKVSEHGPFVYFVSKMADGEMEWR